MKFILFYYQLGRHVRTTNDDATSAHDDAAANDDGPSAHVRSSSSTTGTHDHHSWRQQRQWKRIPMPRLRKINWTDPQKNHWLRDYSLVPLPFGFHRRNGLVLSLLR